jgi:hypothetical protein
MRHSRLGSPLPIGALAVAMCFLTRLGRLVTMAGCQDLSPPHSLPAGVTAIALASVAATTQSKDGIAVGVEASARTKSVYRRCLCCSHSLATIPHRDDRTDDGAFGAMMSLASGKSPKNDDF